MNVEGTNGGSVTVGLPEGRTLAQLIEAYRTDPVSRYHKLRYETRVNHDGLLRRMSASFGHLTLAEIRSRTIDQMYHVWSAGGDKMPMGHMFMSKLRTICKFGTRTLEDEEATRISVILSASKFEVSTKPPGDVLKAHQVTAIREKAREIGYFSIALSQAFQFDCMLRQRDCIGSWIPEAEKGDSDVHHDGEKWLRGLRWEEIDADLVMRHVTSKKQKPLTVPLSLAPMVMEELDHMPSFLKRRTGPVIICEATALPWRVAEFRRKWRMIADLCDIPKDIKNMHSRHSGVSEGTDAGVPLEHLRHAATHSDIQTTQRYSRNAEQKVAESLRMRVAYRNQEKG